MLAVLGPAVLIFFMRVTDITLYTMRIMMVMRGRKLLAWVFAFFQATMYVMAIRVVFTDLGNWVKIIGYAAGFATGNVVGMWLESRLAIGKTHLRIISRALGAEIADTLRQDGYAVTEIPASGRDGAVTLLHVGVRRRDAETVMEQASAIDQGAFITSEDIQSFQRGYWHKR